MKLTKFLSMLLCLALIFTLASCGGDDDPVTPTPINNGSEPTYWDQDGNGVEDWQEKECTITFATWQYTDPDGLNVTIDTVMADKFMEKYPNIHIQFVSAGEEYEYDENMIAMMETNTLPDVFLIRRLENFLPYNMLANITEMYANDPDTQYIFKSLESGGVYNGQRYAIPTYIYPQFWVVNKTLLAEKNIPLPTYDWTWEQMESIAKQANDESKHIIGLYGRQGYYGEGATSAYQTELTKILKIREDANVGKTWAGWGYDGIRFNFDSSAFLQAMNKMETALSEGWMKRGLTAEEKLEYYNAEDYKPTSGGKVAIWQEASWSFKDEISVIGETFEWDIYPGPSGVTGGNSDIIGVSSLCRNKQAAYQFMKWMSFSEEGIVTRFDIYRNYGSELYVQGNNYPYPIADYGIDAYGVNKIWDNIPYGDTAAGLVTPQFKEALRNGAFKLNKEVVGWDAVDYAAGGYFADIFAGDTTFAAVQAQIQTDADAEFARVREEIDAAIALNR